MAVKSQLSVPLSQNTAPVFKFDCLYTHDLVRKQKRWQDGLLAFHTFNKRVMVYDLTNNFIGDTHWREAEFVQVGDDLRLDRGVLVEVGEAKGRKEQDISEIFAKKNAVVRESSSPLVPVRSSGQKPRSISAVLEASKRGVSRATRAPPPPFIVPGGSSPYDVDSQRSPKRRKLANETPPRRALAEKTVQSKPATQSTSNRVQSGAVSTKPAERATKLNTDRVELQSAPSKARRNSGPVQPHPEQTKGTRNDVTSKAQKPKKKAESIGASILAKTNRKSVINPDEPSKGNRRAVEKPKKSATTTPSDSVIIDLINHDKPKSKLLASKSRRKKLIFQEMLPVENNSTCRNTPQSRKTSRTSTQSSHPIDEEFQDHIDRLPPPREVIVISSPIKDWAEHGISEDGEDESPRTARKSFTTRKIGTKSPPDRIIVEQSKVGSNAQQIPEIGSIREIQTMAKEELVDDIEDFTELINDENLFAPSVDDSVYPNPEDTHKNNGERENSHVPSPAGGETVEDLHPMLEETETPSETPSAAAVDIDPTNLLPSASGIDLGVEISAAAETEKEDETKLDGTTVPTKAVQDPCLARANPSVNQTTTPIVEETDNATEPPAHQPQPQPPSPVPAVTAAEEKDPAPTDHPPPRQALVKPLAPLAPLLRTPNPLLTTLPPQKPLPQFRPPQQTSHPTNAARSRRSPLQKSLSTSANAVSMGESTVAALARAESDGVVGTLSYTLADYDETGPWSREAFDLFGWTPDENKGRVLGPVAGRACGCRAAATAAGKM